MDYRSMRARFVASARGRDRSKSGTASRVIMRRTQARTSLVVPPRVSTLFRKYKRVFLERESTLAPIVYARNLFKRASDDSAGRIDNFFFLANLRSSAFACSHTLSFLYLKDHVISRFICYKICRILVV